MGEIKNRIEQYGEKFVFAAMAVMFVMAAFLAVKGAVRMTAGGNVEEDGRKCVVIDAGHEKTDGRLKESVAAKSCILGIIVAIMIL